MDLTIPDDAVDITMKLALLQDKNQAFLISSRGGQSQPMVSVPELNTSFLLSEALSDQVISQIQFVRNLKGIHS